LDTVKTNMKFVRFPC